MRKLWISIWLMLTVFTSAQAVEAEIVRIGQDGPWCYALDALHQAIITDWRWEDLEAIPETVEIPAEIDGCPVYKLARNAFSTEGLTGEFTLIVPETVDTIELAFVNCGAREIVLPRTIRTIMGCSLRGCRAEITLDDGGRFLTVEDGFLVWTDNRWLTGSGLRYLVYAAPSTVGKALPEMDYLSHYTLENYLTADSGDILLPERVRLVGCHDLPQGTALTAANPDATYTARSASGLFEYRRIADGAEITKWCHWYADEIPQTVIVPGMVDGLTVTRIGMTAFSSAEHVNREPFTLILPEGLREIDRLALWRCPAERVRLPSSLRDVPEGAFAGFDGCITLAENHPTLAMENGFLINRAASVLLFATTDAGTALPRVKRIAAGALSQWRAPTTLRIPAGVESLGDELFGYSWESGFVQRLILPDSLTEMGHSAFYGTNLRQIEFGSGLTRIPEDAFANTRLTVVTLPESVAFVAYTAFDAGVQVEALNPDCHFETQSEYTRRTGDDGLFP